MSAVEDRLAEIAARRSRATRWAAPVDVHEVVYDDVPALTAALRAVLAIADEKDASADLDDRLGSLRLRVAIAVALGVTP